MKRQIYLISLTLVITSLCVYPIIMLNTLNIYNFYFLKINNYRCVLLSRFSRVLTLCDRMDCCPPGSCPWESRGKNNGVGHHTLLQGIFPTQGSNPCLLCLLCCRQVFFTTSTTWEVPQNDSYPLK